MFVFFVIEIVANDNNAFINAELGGGHGGRKFKFVLLFPVSAIFAHGSDNVLDLFVDSADLGRFLT